MSDVPVATKRTLVRELVTGSDDLNSHLDWMQDLEHCSYFVMSSR
jgi:hypothetical protein